jgi:hypothetical protein
MASIDEEIEVKEGMIGYVKKNWRRAVVSLYILLLQFIFLSWAANIINWKTRGLFWRIFFFWFLFFMVICDPLIKKYALKQKNQ